MQPVYLDLDGAVLALQEEPDLDPVVAVRDHYSLDLPHLLPTSVAYAIAYIYPFGVLKSLLLLCLRDDTTLTSGRVRRREVCQSEAEMQCAKLQDESAGTLTTKRLSDRR